MTVQTPAHRLEAERAVLGAMLMDASAVDAARLILHREDFFSEGHRVAYQVICEVADSGLTPDLVTVGEELRRRGLVDKLPDLQGIKYLGECMSAPSSPKLVDDYARLVREASLERRVSVLLQRTAADKSAENVQALGKLILELQGAKSAAVFDFRHHLGDALIDLFTKPDPGLLTGFPKLDGYLCGLHPEDGDILTIGARTNMGKTALMVKMATNLAKAQVPVLYLTTEMTEAQIVYRVLPAATGIPAWKFRKRIFSDLEKGQIVDVAKAKLEPLPLGVLGRPQFSIEDIRGAVAAFRPKVVFVDYLQRCAFPKAETTAYQIWAFMRELKTLGLMTKTQVVIGSQLDRKTDKTPNVPPTLSDLSFSGGIEAESAQILLLWQPPQSVLDKRKRWTPPPEGYRYIEGKIAKNRHGQAHVDVDLTLREALVDFDEQREEPEQEEMELADGDGHV